MLIIEGCSTLPPGWGNAQKRCHERADQLANSLSQPARAVAPVADVVVFAGQLEQAWRSALAAAPSAYVPMAQAVQVPELL